MLCTKTLNFFKIHVNHIKLTATFRLNIFLNLVKKILTTDNVKLHDNRSECKSLPKTMIPLIY
jgi:hypothetical protein